MSRRGAGRRPIRSHKNTPKQKGGVKAVRRLVDPSDYGLLTDASQKLTPEIRGSGRLFAAETIAASVVHYSRFSKDHKLRGPDTADIARRVDSHSLHLTATLGRLGVYGSGNKHKLAFELTSPDILEEVRSFESAFETQGSPLGQDPNARDGMTPHLSIAQLNQDWVEYYRDPVTLSRLDAIAHLQGKVVHFMPIDLQKLAP